MTQNPDGSLHEQSFNEGLSEALKEQYASWRDEKDSVQAERQGAVVSPEGRGGRADVLISARDVSPVAIEVAYENDPNPDADAEERIGWTLAKTGETIEATVVVLAPLQAKEMWRDRKHVYEKLAKEKHPLRYATFSSRAEGEVGRWPSEGYIEGSVTDLATLSVAISVPQHKIETLVTEAADNIQAIGQLINERLPKDIQQDIARALGQHTDTKTLLDVMTVASCIWVNAAVIQNKIALVYTCDGDDYKKVLQFDKLSYTNAVMSRNDIIEAWKNILKIDYGSIFKPAYKSFICLPNDPVTSNLIDRIERIAARIAGTFIKPIVDIGGELFQKVVADRKTTAAFYTLANSAELLACLSLPLDIKDFDFKKAIVGDLACGTGALLRAAYRRIREHLERQGLNPKDYHKRWMEDGLYGMDVQPIATHLTAAGLTAMEINEIYSKANIACFSARDGKTGSLEFFKKGSVEDLFGGEKEENPDFVTEDEGRGVGKQGHKVTIASVDFFDLCIMNPPYSRTRGGQSAFDLSGLSDEDRKKSQKRLGEMLQNTFGDMNAGLGSAFAALADRKLKDKGIYASVLPLTAACAGSWEKLRSRIVSRYSDIIAVGMASDKHKSFSADTSINEMLLVGRKCKKQKLENSIFFVNLYNPPQSIVESQEIARLCQLEIKKEKNIGDLKIGKDYVGKWLRLPIKNNLEQPWGAVGAHSAQLCLTVFNLCNGRLLWVGAGESNPINIPITTLGNLFALGPTHDLIGHPDNGDGRGAFKFKPLLRGEVPVRPSLWKTYAATQCSFVVSPTHDGLGVHGREKEQDRMWKSASRWFWSRSMNWGSQSLQAAQTDTLAMGGRAWVSLSSGAMNDESVFHAASLWGNSIFGLIVRWWHSQRTQPGRATSQIKDTGKMPIPDFSAKTQTAERACKIASNFFKDNLSLSLSPASAAWQDTARHHIDETVADMLALPHPHAENIELLRRLWCREPSVHGGSKKLMKELGI